MTEVGHDRLYNVLLRRLGLKTLQGMKLDDTVQPVAIVDDFTDLTRPLVGATFGSGALQAGVVGRNSAAELDSRSSAGWLLWWDDDSSNFGRINVGRATLITADLVVVGAALFRAGDQAQSIAAQRFEHRTGTVAGAPLGVRTRANVEWINSFFMPPGTVITIVNPAANDPQSISFLWVELPDL